MKNGGKCQQKKGGLIQTMRKRVRPLSHFAFFLMKLPIYNPNKFN